MSVVTLDSPTVTSPISTPWGPADELRSRKLRPGPGNSPTAVERNHRERLYGATVAVVAQHGYEATRVADILALAGVSRSAFYRYFDNKRECFLATLDALEAAAAPCLARAYSSRDRPWDERLRAVFDALLALVIDQPAAARLWFIEIYSAGPEAVGRLERIADQLGDFAADTIDETPERAGMPAEGVRAVLGGFRQIIHTRLRHGREDELRELAPALLDWALSYRTPPERLRRPRKPPRLRAAAPDPDDQRRRILTAVTELVAERDYQELTISEVAQRAAISLSTFYAHFASKHDAFLAALDDGERQLVEATLPTFQSAPDWPRATRNTIHALLAFNATHPEMATLGSMSIFAGGTRAFDRHERATERFQVLLRGGYAEHPGVDPIVGEAVGNSIAALMYQQIRRRGPQRLYELAGIATFIALAPFVGSDAACALANQGWQPAVGA